MVFYFTWMDAPGTETETATEINDEDVFSLQITHEEGEFPAMDLELRNPHVGLLAPGRQRWAKLSYDDGSGPVLLFMGRLVAIPKELYGEIVRLSFIARPPDFVEQKEDLAESLRVAPYWDPLFIPFEDVEDPDRVLDARTALWHIDRKTLEVSVSDIITGEDGVEIFGEADVFYDSVSVSYGSAPARRAVVHAEIGWQQKGGGTVNITHDLLSAYAAASTYTTRDYLQQPYSTFPKKTIALMGAEGFVRSWPQYGTSLGGGWSVGRSTISYVGETPEGDLIVGSAGIEDMDQQSIKDVLNGAGITVQVIQGWHPLGRPNYADIQIVWLPIQQVSPFMELDWTSDRERVETLDFAVNADVQDVLTETDEAEVIYINAASARVDEAVDDDGDMPIKDPLRRAYFPTARGQQSVQYLMSLARAKLLDRARTGEVSFETTFANGVDLSLRKSCQVVDPRLPGGMAAGKIKAYTLSFDGESGTGLTEVVVAATIGRGGTVSAAAGTPSYCSADYCGADYQVYTGRVIMPHANELTYEMDGLLVEPGDDGLNLQTVGRGFLQSIVVTGGLDAQVDAVESKPSYRRGPRGQFIEERVYENVTEVQQTIKSITTETTVTMTPITGGPFLTPYELTVSDLKVPNTLDLEAV